MPLFGYRTLDQLLRPRKSRRVAQNRRKVLRTRRGRTARLERLEDRTLLAVVTWDGGGGDLNWNTADNWSSDVLPGADDDVVIADVAPDIAIVHSSGTTSIKSLTSDEALVISGGTFEIATASSISDTLALGSSSVAILTGSGEITVGGLFTWTGGRLQGAGKLIAGGGMLIEGGSTKYLERAVDNTGLATWTGGSISASADGVFNNLAGATLDAQSNNSISGTFNNAGTLLKSAGTGSSSFFTVMNNTGSVHVQSGTLVFFGGGNSSGSFQVDADSTLRVHGGTQALDANSTWSGAGTVSITHGTLDVASNISIGNLELIQSSSSFIPILTGSGNVTVDGLFTWTGGRLQGTGKLIAGGGMLIEGIRTKVLERTVDNAGVATWTDGAISASAEGVFNNLAGATFDAQSDDSIVGSTATFNNAGTLLKSAGTGLSRFYTVMNNTGSVHVQSGTLAFSGGGSSSGSFQIDTGSTLELSSGTLVLNDGWNATGEGDLLVTGGTLDAASSGSIDNLALGSSFSAILTGSGDVTVGGLFTWTGGRLQGAGKLIAGGGMLIEGGSTKYLERTVDNTGLATWTGGSISASADGVFNNLAGATLDAQSNNSISGTFNNAGTLLKSAGTGFSSFSTVMNNTGSVHVQSGVLTFGAGIYTQTDGETILDGGNLSSVNPLDIQGGVLTGSGKVSGDVIMKGRIAPGASAGDFGTIQIVGDYIQIPTLDAGGPYTVDEDGSVQLNATISESDGVFEIEIGGIAAFDQLDVDGSITLGGPLNLSFSGGFEPAIGDTFTVVNNEGTDAIKGAFAGLPEGATFTVGNTQFQISYAGGTDSNDVVLTAIDPTAPDQGGDTLEFQWDLDGDSIFGETGAAAERGDEVGGSVNFSAVELDGPATFTVDVRASFGSGFSDVASTEVNVSDNTATPLPDLAISASDISFSPANPSPGESVTISATIQNQGQIDASNIEVALFDFDALIGEATIASLASGATEEVSILTSFPESGFHLLTFKIDRLDTILELGEGNNEAGKLLQVGTPDTTPAVMVVEAPATSAFQGAAASIAGSASFEFETAAGTQYFPVQGGTVHVTVVDPVTSDIVGVFSGDNTNVVGDFSQYILAPSTVGSFTLIVQVTDGTVIGETQTTLEVLEASTDPGSTPGGDPDPTPRLQLAIAASSISENAGADATTATVSRVNIDDLSSNLAVALFSNDTSEATVPGQVVIPAGETSVTVPIAAVDDDVIDGTQWVTITASAAGFIAHDMVRVTDDESPPPTTPPGTQDIRLLSDDIVFSNDNPDVGETTIIFASVNYSGTQPASDVPISFFDIYPGENGLQPFPIGSTSVSFPEGGASSPAMIALPWTNQAEGAHVIQVVASPTFPQATGNDQATRSIIVGSILEQLITIEYQDPPTLLVDADANGVFSPGDTLQYTINFANTGATDVTGAAIFDDFDETLLGTPFNISDGGTASAGAVTWELGTIAAGESGSVTYDVIIKPAAEFPSATNLVANTTFLTADQTVPTSDSIQIGVLLETTPPTTSAAVTPNANAAGWNNTDVNLTLSSVDEPGGSGVSLITYSIDGGPPITESGDTVSLLFTDEGIHTVTYYAVDAAFNAEAEQNVQVKIDKTDPVPVHSGPFAVDEGSSILLDGSASADSLSGIQSIAWSIDSDGEFVDGNSAVFSGLDGPSTHDVSLRVTDVAGNVAIAATQVVVNNVAPTVAAGADGTINEGSAFTSSGSFTDPGADSWTATVDYGDGSGVQALALNADKTFDLSHTYVDDGAYTVTVTVTDDDGEAGGNTLQVTVLNVVDLAGRVFNDLDNDGVFDSGESGLPDVGIELVRESDDAVVAATTTGPDGTYEFDFSELGIPAGTYTIRQQSQPAGYLDGLESTGDLGGAAADNGTVINNADSNAITGIVIREPGTQQDTAGYDFAKIRPSSLQGLVWEDFDNDAEVDFSEMAIDRVAVTLSGSDDRGNAVSISQSTDGQGIFEFVDLRPGTYSISEAQPAGFIDGKDVVGLVNGMLTGDHDGGTPTLSTTNDQFTNVILAAPDSTGINYNFGERVDGGTLSSGQTATIGFWQNINGQRLIESLNGSADSTLLAEYLSGTFSNMYGMLADADGDDTFGDYMTNVQVADLYQDLFKRNGRTSSGGPPKLDAQVMAVAMATYLTKQSFVEVSFASSGPHTVDSSLIDEVESFGIVVTVGGIGSTFVNVGDNGAAFGVSDNSDVQVIDLVLATNSWSKDGLLYDADGDGTIDDLEALNRILANDLYSLINEI